MFQVGFQLEGYALAVCTGELKLSAYCGTARLIGEVCRREGSRHVLLDLLGATPKMSERDHVELGEFIAPEFRGLTVAVVVPSVQRVGTGEQVAQVSGAHLKTFTSLPDAEEWLLAEVRGAGVRR